jgi:hypothetical protein
MPSYHPVAAPSQRQRLSRQLESGQRQSRAATRALHDNLGGQVPPINAGPGTLLAPAGSHIEAWLGGNAMVTLK